MIEPVPYFLWICPSAFSIARARIACSSRLGARLSATSRPEGASFSFVATMVHLSFLPPFAALRSGGRGLPRRSSLRLADRRARRRSVELASVRHDARVRARLAVLVLEGLDPEPALD